MGAGYNFQKFTAAILALSNSKIWLEAKPEWMLHTVYDDPSERSCECGHQHIRQICVIKNQENDNEAEVGNVCVHNFMQLASRRIFAVIDRVRAELSKSLNPAALDLFRRRGVINVAEEEEYKSYWRKRKNLTENQRKQKLDINQRIMNYIDTETPKLIANFLNKGIKPRG